MTKTAAYAAWAVITLGLIAGFVWLVVSGHPWMAMASLLLSPSFKSGDGE